MTIDTVIIFIGTLIVALPFLGFPPRWDTALMVLAGLIVVLLGIVLRRGPRKGTQTQNTTSRPTESTTLPESGHDSL